MNGEEFYKLFKKAIEHFELRWVDKDQITVTIDKDAIVFTYQLQSISYRL
jgi:hypothetical protein